MVIAVTACLSFRKSHAGFLGAAFIDATARHLFTFLLEHSIHSALPCGPRSNPDRTCSDERLSWIAPGCRPSRRLLERVPQVEVFSRGERSCLLSPLLAGYERNRTFRREHGNASLLSSLFQPFQELLLCDLQSLWVLPVDHTLGTHRSPVWTIGSKLAGTFTAWLFAVVALFSFHDFLPLFHRVHNFHQVIGVNKIILDF